LLTTSREDTRISPLLTASNRLSRPKKLKMQEYRQLLQAATQGSNTKSHQCNKEDHRAVLTKRELEMYWIIQLLSRNNNISSFFLTTSVSNGANRHPCEETLWQPWNRICNSTVSWMRVNFASWTTLIT
jgi:hypothetical protein